MKIPIVKCHQILLFLCSELLRIPPKLWKTQGVLRKKAGKGVRSRFCTLRKCGRSSRPPPSLQELPFFLFFLLFMRKWRLNCRTNRRRKLLDKIPESESATSLNIKTAMSFFFFFSPSSILETIPFVSSLAVATRWHWVSTLCWTGKPFLIDSLLFHHSSNRD